MKKTYTKIINVPHNHNGVITHLESDILEYKVNWALGSIIANKGSRGNEIPTKSF